MEINEFILKEKTIDESITFYSFEEVFNYCLNYIENNFVKKNIVLKDDLMFCFRIKDTNEIFHLLGCIYDGESIVYKEIHFL